MAQEDQKTFTDLVRQLVGRCGSDIEKARYFLNIYWESAMIFYIFHIDIVYLSYLS